ncbi:MAG: helix-hairpin-helix domain-containing protein [Candidatus Omnitrophica bacterium]|nr:helix-hairpin-helix domain-containing protein [Candidatus Omnitrophota bacterium]
MMWLNRQEQLTLAGLGVLGLVGLGILAWQGQRSSVTIQGVPAPVDTTPWDAALRRAHHVDINAATVAELERLPLVGPTLARRIVEYRQAHGPFLRPEDLSRVRGIGPKTFEGLRDHITAQ